MNSVTFSMSVRQNGQRYRVEKPPDCAVVFASSSCIPI